MKIPSTTMEIQPIAPDYEKCLVTIKDKYGVESRWMVPTEKKLSDEELRLMFEAHTTLSQGTTGRN